MLGLMSAIDEPHRPRARSGLVRWLRRAAVALVAFAALTYTAAGAYLGWALLRPLRLSATAPSTVVTAAGVATRVKHWPATHPEGLPALVLVPGFAESTYVWSRVAPLLAADHDVYAYDVRGFGFSTRTPPYTLAADTDQLAGVIAALRLTRPIVVGHSSGVAVALSLALRDPTSVSGVVAANGDGTPYFGADRTSGISGDFTSPLFTPILAAMITAVARHRSLVRMLVSARCGPGCPVNDAAIDRWRAPLLSPGGIAALVTIAQQPLIGLTDAQETAITVPTAVLYSSHDETFDRASALLTAARLHTRLITGLPRGQHLALLGEPTRFTSLLTQQIARLPAR
jgi:pimeloyl-ACP methyl ester carboxylesterase